MRALIGGLGLVLASTAAAREISFEERVRAEEAIERVRFSHQAGATESFERAVPRALLERRVRTALAESAALASRWRTPISAEALRNEIQRIARDTRLPERLLEIYDALGDDPVLVQECLARGVLADRWARQHFDAEGVKSDWGAWWASVEDDFATTPVPVVAGEAPLPLPSSSLASCQPGNTWDNGSLGAVPEGRASASVVWTGHVMLVWGGSRDGRSLGSGGRYDPVTDTWSAMSSAGAPAPRWGQSAVWTGSRMIVWGGTLAGGGQTATGALYDPAGDVWTPMSTTGAPQARQDHTAVWTGTSLVVWGGSYSDVSGVTQYLTDGARYDPVSGSWSPISSLGAPEGRKSASAVWTGSTMVVWGGDRSDGVTTTTLDTGGRYDPASDTWLPTSTVGAAFGRTYHRAVWTGSTMVVWGGQFWPTPGVRQYLGSGGRYDPATDSWSPMSTAGAPSARIGHAMAADESLVLVWGGQGAAGWAGTGGRYDALSDTWTPMSPAGALSPRTNVAGVWTGSRLVLWSGAASAGTFPDSGSRYDPALDQWTPTFSANAPVPRESASVVWTGNEMIVWGGLHNEEPLATGGRYDPLTDTWTPTSVSPLNRARVFHTAVWTGARMVVWGGEPCPNIYDKGTSYDPVSDTWTALDYLTEPAPRRRHTAVWTGNRMVVWGGLLCTSPPVATATGSRYDPVTNSWSPIIGTGAPSGRQAHTAVWTEGSMIVWGGADEAGVATNAGGRYDPLANAWSATRKQGAPAARRDHTAVWTGSSMIVWGGAAATDLDTGGRYDPVSDQWTATATVGAPSPRLGHSAVWTGDEMVVWGGDTSLAGSGDALATGGRYDPGSDTWTPTSLLGAPSPRTHQKAVWTGSFMVVWGGIGWTVPSSGGRYVVGNPDGDADGVADACDCAPGNPAVFAVPGEIAGLAFAADKTTLTWTSASGGPSTVHDGMVGDLAGLPVSDGAGTACMGPGTGATSIVDASVPPPGTGRWYLVRGRNACGAGTLGAASGGTERVSNVCP